MSCGDKKSCCGPVPKPSQEAEEKKECCPGGQTCGDSKPQVQDSKEEELRNFVRDHYKKIVCGPGSCESGSCFVGNQSEEYAAKLGYSKEDLAAIPEGKIPDMRGDKARSIDQLYFLENKEPTLAKAVATHWPSLNSNQVKWCWILEAVLDLMPFWPSEQSVMFISRNLNPAKYTI